MSIVAPTSATARVGVRRDLPPEWEGAFQHTVKDRRYYELVEDTLPGQFEHRYLLIEEPEAAPLVQPCFFVDQDLVAAAPGPVRGLVAVLRRAMPRLLRLRLLMVGCAAGEGHLASEDSWEQQRIAESVRPILPRLAREGGAKLIVWKDVPKAYRPGLTLLIASGEYVRIPSMPSTVLPVDFASFEEYLQRHVGRVSRKSIRRKLRASDAHANGALQMTVHRDIGDLVDELYPLYLQVHGRSSLQFEKLTPEFLVELGRRMPDRARFFVWRERGRAVAFSICLQHGDALYDEYLGLDYRIALDRHLYFVTIRDLLEWSIANGIRQYFSTPLNYDPKLHLGFRLAPVDLYVRATASWLQPLIRHALPWIEPTRSEPALRQFPNASELADRSD